MSRVRALRRAWRTFWWMVVNRKPGAGLSRRAYLVSALRQARCGLLTGGEHSWGPLRAEYEGQRWRKQSCRWCQAKRTPAEEMDRNPPTAVEEQEMRRFIPTAPPSDEDVAHAMAIAEARGIYRDGKWLWD